MIIEKYELAPAYFQIIEMPVGSIILGVKLIDGRLFLFVKIEPGMELKQFYFTVIKTGESLPSDVGEYIGTVIKDSTEIHVFEKN